MLTLLYLTHRIQSNLSLSSFLTHRWLMCWCLQWLTQSPWPQLFLRYIGESRPFGPAILTEVCQAFAQRSPSHCLVCSLGKHLTYTPDHLVYYRQVHTTDISAVGEIGMPGLMPISPVCHYWWSSSGMAQHTIGMIQTANL